MSSTEAANPDATSSSSIVAERQRTLRIPKGFQALLESFAREVLRSQPPDIYAFGADYFDRIVQIRATGDSVPQVSDVAQSQTTQEPSAEQSTENPTAKAEQIEVKDEPASGLVLVGVEQEASQEQQAMDKQEAASSAQSAAARMTSSADEEPIDIDLNDPDVQAAAAKIQKGWGNRRAAAAAATESQQKPQEQPKPQVEAKVAEQDEVVDIDLNDPEVQAAAAKIQKGWGTRKLAAKQQAPQ